MEKNIFSSVDNENENNNKARDTSSIIQNYNEVIVSFPENFGTL